MRSVPLLLVVVPIACMFDSSPAPTPDHTSNQPPSKLQLPHAGNAPPVVTMSWCASAGCTLVFDFAAPLPDAKLVFEPEQKGTQSWKTPTQLVFEPAKGAMLAGHALVVTIPTAGFTQAFEVPFFEAAGKVARWPVQPGKPRFVAFLNGFSAQLGRGALFALYDQPVDPAAIARSARVKSGGKRISTDIRRPTSTTQIYDRPIELANLVTLQLDRLPDDGDTVTIELPSIDDTGTDSPHVADLFVNTTLTGGSVAEVSDDGTSKGRRTPLHAEWSIPFSNQVTAKAFESHVAIEPKPKSMYTHVWGVRGQVDAELEPGVVYKLVVDDTLRDVLGNKLRSPVMASFRSQDAKPTLALPTDGLVLEAGRARLPVRMTNAGQLKLTTERFSTVAAWLAARAANTPCTGSETDVDATGPLNQQVTRDITLDPGLYCLSLGGKGRGSEAKGEDLAATTYTQVSALGITAKLYDEHVFAWVTRLADGRPVADAKLSLIDDGGGQLGTATTAADGTATFDKVTVAGRAGLTAHVSIVVGDGQLVASLSDDGLSNARQFDLDGKIRDAEPLVASVFTERGVYRPGEAVHVKALVRDPETSRAATGEVTLAVNDARGEQIITQAVKLDRFGGATLEVPLKEDAKVGDYTVHATMGARSSVRSFRVEEYRVPTFAVAVASDEDWTAGTATHASITASYLHGGPLAGRDVSYEVSRMPETFSPPGFPSFVFADMATVPHATESLTHGTAKLDGQGHFVVTIKPDHGSKAGPMRYIVDASVTDVDRQAYAGKLSKVVHPADFYVGIAPPSRRVMSAGETLEVPVEAVSPDGAPKAGIDATVSLERVDYHGVTRLDDEGTQRLVRPVPTAVAQCSVTTRATPVTCKLAVATAGEYVVRVAGQDGKHRRVEAAFALSASGRTSVAWPRFDHERIQLVADKASYKPGDVARLVVQSPFPEARGLLTIERDGVIDHRVFAISGDTPELRIPITDAQVPNVYA
ncbi:MAG TPA: MG2 domain-containing protein, partial [Kofleriaceae bacterium]|nr:MG2 domain-containing protein [Kofleriaceae bacterium]